MNRFVWAAVLCAVSVLGCDSVLGIKQLPRATFAYESGKCEQCAVQACGSELDACRSDPNCTAMYAKLAACAVNDPGCRYKAEGRKRKASGLPQTYQDLDACRRKACLDDCYGTDTLAEALGTPCQDCMHRNCASSVRACIGGVTEAGADVGRGDCERAASCAVDTSPPNPNHWLWCLDGRDLSQLASGVFACGAQCVSCAPGQDFSCVSGYRWQTPGNAKSIDTRLDLHVPNATVQANRNCDPGLGTAAQATTDQEGVADLNVPLPFQGCFRFSKPGYPMHLLYVERPLETFQGTWSREFWDTNTVNSHIKPYALSKDTGAIFANVQDCWDRAAQGIEIKTNLPTAPPEIDWDVHGYPTASGHTAYVWFLNVPPSNVDVELTATYGGTQVAHAYVRVEAGAVTVANMYPDTQ